MHNLFGYILLLLGLALAGDVLHRAAQQLGHPGLGDDHLAALQRDDPAVHAGAEAALGGRLLVVGRIDVHPNGTNAVPSRVTAWLDARAESSPSLIALTDAIERQAGERADRDGTTVTVTRESVSGEVSFDVALSRAVGGERPALPTQAGHDAGILQAAGIDSAMLFVRNPTGVSHSPEETAELADCIAGVEALADALTGLVG